jgi:sulfide:quinone oxidoreductase
VAGLETLMALHALAGDRVRVTLAGGDATFDVSAMDPARAFGLAPVRCHHVGRIAAEHGAAYVQDVVTGVDTTARRASLGRGTLEWDALVVAVGAGSRAVLPHAQTATWWRMTRIVTELRRDIAAGAVRSVAFVAPPGAYWPLPLYELALLTRRDAGPRVALWLITTESGPLSSFGASTSALVAGLLADRRIAFVGDAYATTHRHGRVTVRPHRRVVVADRVVALPRPVGPALPGLPHDRDGFLAADQHGRVRDVDGVYAAGDCTAFPVKSGALAAQEADAAAAQIAAAAGAALQAEPFRPRLHGRLILGTSAATLRHDIAGGAGEGRAAVAAAWSPEAKIQARFLTPWLEHHQHPVDDRALLSGLDLAASG